jgi:GT2 family glycosyltransferase
MFLIVFSRVQMEFVTKGYKFMFIATDMVPLDKAREFLFRSALSSGRNLKYTLWLDTDMFVSGEQISALIDYLESHQDVAAVSALYFKKVSFDPVCFRKVVENSIESYPPFCPPTSEPTEVDATGLGCMLVRTSFMKENLASHKKVFWFDEYPEDINFCIQIRQAGGKIVVLPNIVVPHQGGYVTDAHYNKLKEKKK